MIMMYQTENYRLYQDSSNTTLVVHYTIIMDDHIRTSIQAGTDSRDRFIYTVPLDIYNYDHRYHIIKLIW